MNNILKKSAFSLCLLWLVVSMVSPVLSNAAGKNTKANSEEQSTTMITTVEGIIDKVSDDSIVVRDKRYTTTGVPLVKPSGEPALNDQLTIGKKVEIFFQNKVMTSILIFENAVQ